MSRVADLLGRGVRVTVADLPEGAAAEIPAEFFESGDARASLRSDLPIDVTDFQQVYADAGVPAPQRGYGIDKMVDILESKRLASLPREVRVAAVMASLEAAGAPLQQVVKDAALRERALSGFVLAKQREVEALQKRNEAKVAELKQEISAFVGDKNREIDGLEQASRTAGSAFSQLQLRKRQEEERLREVVGHFLPDAENPIPKPAKG